MAIPEKKPGEKYSYADYLTWDDGERWELIDGVPYNMSPAPKIRHQEILGELAGVFYNFLKGKPCRVYIAPVDVRFKDEIHAADKETYTVVQPDLLVVCDRDKVDEKGVIGAPDICIEILSVSTAYKDQGEKFVLFEKHGVREYWIINPELETVQLFVHNGTAFDKPLYYRKDEVLKSTVLEGLDLVLAEVFGENG